MIDIYNIYNTYDYIIYALFIQSIILHLLRSGSLAGRCSHCFSEGATLYTIDYIIHILEVGG